MRSLIVLVLLLGAGGGQALAEVRPSPPPSSSTAIKVEHEAAITNCVRLWDRGTHMTEQQWLVACKRVQNRLLNLQAK